MMIAWVLRLKCLLLESSKSNFAKEIHTANGIHMNLSLLLHRVLPSVSLLQSGGFLLSFICKSMYTIYCLATKTQQRNLIVPKKFLSLFSLTQRAACIMKYMAVRKFIPFFFRLNELRYLCIVLVSTHVFETSDVT